MTDVAQRSVLVLGLSRAGKSSYIGQVLSRLHARSEGRLRAARSLPSGPYRDLLAELAAGIPPQHTPHGVYEETPLYLQDTLYDQTVEILWPEYAGEQLREIIDQRRVPRHWAERVAASDVWILFVRPTLVPLPEDSVTRGIPPQSGETGSLVAASQPETHEWVSAQAQMIEGLQILSFLRQSTIQRRRRSPVLGVVVSAIDEIRVRESGTSPEKLLADHLPMLHEYVRANWMEDACMIVGVSALGRELDPNQPDEAFQIEGPENQGYLVLPDGLETRDLTLGLSLLLDRARV